MGLQDYKRKRNFSSTPEPSGKSKGAGGLRFYIQKHEASHLHYDFRLELGGVLKSWAVPKGPSLDPKQKRLAVMVEDHPLDYGNFQGRIPKGNYGAGLVTVWDKGTYSSIENSSGKDEDIIRQGLQKGHLKLLLHGEKLNGGFNLVRLESDPKNWLLIKEKDEFSTSKDIFISKQEAMPHNIRPMLAESSEQAFNRKGWIFEIKWDGYRAIAEISNNKVKLYSRNGLDLKKQFPAIAKNLEKLEGKSVLDGEVVAFKNGRPSFNALQNARQSDLAYVIFDILYFNGEDLRAKALIERKEKLKDLFEWPDNIFVPYYVMDKGLDYFRAIKKQNIEGMMAKDASSPYLEGVRSRSWLKIKIQKTSEAVIIGFTEPKGSRKDFGALVLGSYEGKKLKYIGHCGSGFSDKSLGDLRRKLEKYRQDSSPISEKIPVNAPVTWVKPKIVCQVRFTEWTADGLMRHPVFLGLRDDKDAREVEQEKPINGKLKEEDIEISNPEKIFWPKEKYTKKDVIDYYEKISQVMLPYLKDRPQSLLRHPNGISKPGFYQKDIDFATPNFVTLKKIWSESNNADINFMLCQNKESLMYMANLGCIEINPWNSRISKPDNPDYMIIDLDPGKRKFSDLIIVAQEVHRVLDLACEESYIKTSGKSGLHIFVPLGAKYTYDQVRSLALIIVRIVNNKLPQLTSIERTPANRGGKIYLDYLQNRRGQTLAAAYSLRPMPGATVSTPLEWREVKTGLDPKKFTIKSIFARIKKKGDLWKGVLGSGIDLEKSLRCLEREFGKK